MGAKFVPLTMDLISEGEFLQDAEADFGDLQRNLIGFCRQYRDKAEKASATLTLKLTLRVEDVDSELFSIRAETTVKRPARPANVSAAMAADDVDDRPLLHVRAAGSDATHPRQGKFATRDGRTIDPVTGEAE
jgi:hypothetical protein